MNINKTFCDVAMVIIAVYLELALYLKCHRLWEGGLNQQSNLVGVNYNQMHSGKNTTNLIVVV